MELISRTVDRINFHFRDARERAFYRLPFVPQHAGVTGRNARDVCTYTSAGRRPSDERDVELDEHPDVGKS